MDVFSKRPLFIACMTFLGFSIAGYFMHTFLKYVFILMASVSIVIFLILLCFKQMNTMKQNWSIIYILVSLMIILSLSSSLMYFDKGEKTYSKYYDSEHKIDAVVISKEYAGDFNAKYIVDVKYIDGVEMNHKAPLYCEYPAGLEVGDKITANVTGTRPEEQGGGFNEKVYMLSNGMFINYTAPNESTLAAREFTDYSVKLSFAYFNEELSRIITDGIGGEEGNFTSALFLGNRELISNTVSRDFSRTGASHILALSGMHMTIVMGAAMLILRMFTSNYKFTSVFLSIMALFYLGLTGFSVSATRAVIMLLVTYFLCFVNNSSDPLTSLSISGFIIVLISPGAILDAGFWMSFTATLGILSYLPAFNEVLGNLFTRVKNPAAKSVIKILVKFISAIATSIFAIIPLIAVLCIFIREISLFSIISSLVLSIPASLILLLTLFYLPLSQVPHISSVLSNTIRHIAEFMIDFCKHHSDIEDVLVSLNYPFAVGMAILIAAAILYSLIFKHKKQFMSLIPLALCISLFIGTICLYDYSNVDNIKISYITASSTSDMVLISNKKDVIICDVSNGSKTAYSMAMDEMYEMRATEIKAIVLTRYTNLHNGSLIYTFEREKVRELWLPYPENSDECFSLEILYDYATEHGVKVYTYKYGNSIRILEKINIRHIRTAIDRSKVPISILTIFSGREQAIYVSPGFNESDLAKYTQKEMSKSQYIIFGSRGPKTKTLYGIDNLAGVRGVAFADEIRAAYYIRPEHYFRKYYMVPEKIEFYLKK